MPRPIDTNDPITLGWEDAALGRVARRPVGFLEDATNYELYRYGYAEYLTAEEGVIN